MDKKFAEVMGMSLEEARSETVQKSFAYNSFVLKEELKNLFAVLTKPLEKALDKILF